MESNWDCIVVGGGAAGLSAALVLGRARRRTLVIDAGRQSNLAAHAIGGLLGSNERPPADFYAAGRAEVLAHPTVEIRTGSVADGARVEDGFALTLADGTQVWARRVLLATGMEYRYAEIPGLDRFWGASVFHCPFCHGWEVRERPLGVLDDGASGVHRAMLLRGWSDDVTLLTNGESGLESAEAERLRSAGIAVDERRIQELVGEGRALGGVHFTDGSERTIGGLLVPVTLHQRSPLATRLGADLAPEGPLSAETVRVDGMGVTSVSGLFAAGDAGSPMPSIALAVSTGALAAGGVMGSLMLET